VKRELEIDLCKERHCNREVDHEGPHGFKCDYRSNNPDAWLVWGTPGGGSPELVWTPRFYWLFGFERHRNAGVFSMGLGPLQIELGRRWITQHRGIHDIGPGGENELVIREEWIEAADSGTDFTELGHLGFYRIRDTREFVCAVCGGQLPPPLPR